MSQPKEINLGQSQTVASTDFTAPPNNLPARATPSRQNLSPITLEEAQSFGLGIGNSVGSITSKITGTTRMGDIDEVGKGLGALLVKAREYDPSVKFKKGFFGLLGRSVAQLQNQFHTVDSAVDALIARVESQINLFNGRLGDLDAIYAENEQKHIELGNLIPEINERISWMEANVPVVDPKDAFTAQRAQEWNNAIAYAKKRVDDLRRLQLLCEMQAPQIMMMKTNAAGLVSKFGELKTTTIPTMKTTFSLYIMNLEQKRAADQAKAITDEFNDSLKRNSELLGQVTRQVATEQSRSVVDFSTLQKVQKDTIDTINAVQKIRSDMVDRIKLEAPKLEAISSEVAVLTARRVN